VLFHYLLNDLSKRTDVEPRIIDIAGLHGRGLGRLLAAIRIAYDTFRLSSQCDVLSIHTGSTSLHLSGPPLVLIAWTLGKPLIIRQGAGTHYRELPVWKRSLVGWAVRRTAFYLVETQRLVELARRDGIAHARWFPNNRPLPPVEKQSPSSRSEARRFVFISRVSREKGIFDILEAARNLPANAMVDVYGPFEDGLGPHIFEGHGSVTYKGLLPPDEVLERLKDYDVLLLPTYYPREGYPGIIIEAFAAGLPVICTQWMCLDEVVNDQCGILIKPRDSAGLRAAMTRIMDDPALFQALRHGARRRAEDFSSTVWTERFIDYCRQTLDQRNGHVPRNDALLS